MARKTTVYKLERYEWPDEKAARIKKRNTIIAFIISMIMAFTLGGYTVYNLFPNRGIISFASNDPQLNKFEKIYTIMKDYWYFGKDYENIEEELINDAINGMMQADVDLHTYYMNQEQSADMVDSLSGSVVGIGVSISQTTGEHLIETVYRKSPAESVGLMPGDIIIGVDGQDVTSLELTELVKITRGEAGTDVNIDIKRGTEYLSFTITRAAFNSSVYSYYVDDVAVLEINSFSENTASGVKEALVDIKNKGTENLIIDLRDNGGGYLTTYIEIAGMFLPDHTICIQQEDKNGNITPYYTDSKEQFTFEQLVLLINENTASAAEVFTAALKENLNATLVGTTTYGKGTVQYPLTLGDGDIMKYTTAEWLTTNGNKINKVGIEPDVEVEIKSGLVSSIEMSDDLKLSVDCVSEYVLVAQSLLEVLGYDIDRKDGYFSKTTENILKEYQAKAELEVSGILDVETMNALVADQLRVYHNDRSVEDIQRQKALDIIHNKN